MTGNYELSTRYIWVSTTLNLALLKGVTMNTYFCYFSVNITTSQYVKETSKHAGVEALYCNNIFLVRIMSQVKLLFYVLQFQTHNEPRESAQ